MGALRNADLSPEEKRSKGQELQGKYQTIMAEVLTPEQMEKLKSSQSEGPQWGGGGQRPGGGGQRPGGGRGGWDSMTPEMWREMADRVPKVGEISGKILEKESGIPVEYATVALLLQMDSSIISGAVTNEKGMFSMDELPMGQFIVTVDFMGFEQQERRDITINPYRQPTVDLGEIVIEMKGEIMNEVVVEEKRPFMELQLDKKVFNVSDNLTVAGGTATEVLEQVPSVEVDLDGNVSLRGSQNLRILIDGRPSALSGSSPADILAQLPAESIDKVEVITAPSAKYDPEGMSGIINIILKKNRKIGITGNVMVGWQIPDIDEYNVAAGLGYRNKKVNVYANYSHRDNNRDSRRSVYRRNMLTDTTYSFDQTGNGVRGSINHRLKAGIDFYPTSSSVIYSSASFGFNKGRDTGENHYQFYDENNLKTHQGLIKDTQDDDGFNQDFSLGYEKRFNNSWDHKLVVDLNYSDNTDEDISYIENGTYTLSGLDEENLMEPLYLQTDMTKDGRQVFQGGVDYEKLFENKSKLEVGGRTIFRYADADFNSSNDLLDNVFSFDEKIHAVYTTYGYPITESFSIKGGIRLEQADTDGELVNTGETFDKNYFSWFPSLSLSQNLGEKGGDLSLNYSRRINRPRRRQINPFVNYSDPLNFRQGNPDLNPEYTNSVELNYMKRWGKLTLTPSVYYRYTTDIINWFSYVDEDSGARTSTFVNMSSSQTYGVELVAMYRPLKWWRIMPSVSLSHTILNPDNIDADLNENALSIGGRFMSNMTVWKNMDIQMFCFFRAPRQTAQGRMKAMVYANFGVKKKILDDKGSIGFNIRDPFGTGRFAFISDTELFYQEAEYRREPYVATLTFSYRFGKQERPRRRGNRGERDGGGGMDGGDDFEGGM
jgi:outer membrane receptor protein involved in Fe transport